MSIRHRLGLLILLASLLGTGCSKSPSSPNGSGSNHRSDNGGFSIAGYKGKNPVLILCSSTVTAASHQRFMTEWKKADAEVKKHALIVVHVQTDAMTGSTATSSDGQSISSEEANDLFETYGSYSRYKATLIGKDGTTKLGRVTPKVDEIVKGLQ